MPPSGSFYPGPNSCLAKPTPALGRHLRGNLWECTEQNPGLPVPQRRLPASQFTAFHNAPGLGQLRGPKSIAREHLFLRTDNDTQRMHVQVTGTSYL